MFQMGANKRTKHHKNKTNWTLRILHLSPLKESFDFVQGQVKVPAMVLYLDWASLISKYTVSCASVEVVMKMTPDRPKESVDCLPSVQKRVAKDKLHQKGLFSFLCWEDDFSSAPRNPLRQFLRTKLSSLCGFKAPIYHNPFSFQNIRFRRQISFGEGSH